MQQTTISQQPSSPRRKRLTEKERTEILARIIDVILADPGQVAESDNAGGSRSVVESIVTSANASMQPGDMA